MKKQFLLGLMAMLLPLTLWAADESTEGFVISLTSSDLTDNTAPYSGKDVSVNVSVEYYYMLGSKRVKYDDLSASTDYNISYSYKAYNSTETKTLDASNPEIKNAGTYTVTVAGKGDFVQSESQSVTFTITRVALDLEGLTAKEGAKIQYGATDDELQNLNILDFVTLTTENNNLIADNDAEIADALKCLTLTKSAGTDDYVGGATLVHVVASEQNTSTNYEYNDNGAFIKVDIKERDLALSWAEGKGSSTYNATEIDVESLINDIAALDVVNGEQVSVTLAAEKTIKDADTYTLTATLTGTNAKNYKLAENTIDYIVNKAALNISVAENVTLGKTYDGEAPAEDITTSFALTTNPANISDDDLKKIALKIEEAGADAKEYDVKLYVNETEITDVTQQTELPNYNISLGEEAFTYVISQKKVTYYFKGEDVKYTGGVISDPKSEVVIVDGFVNQSEDWKTAPQAKVKEGTTVKNVDTYTLELANEPETPDNYEAQLLTEKDLQGEQYTNVNSFNVTPGTMTITVKTQTIDFGTLINDALKARWAQYDSGTGNGSGTVITNDPYETAATDRTNMRKLITFSLSEEAEAANGASGTYTKGIKIALKDEVAGFSADEATILFKNYGGKDKIHLVDGDLVINSVEGLILDGSEGLVVSEDGEEQEDPTEPVQTIADKLKANDGATVTTVKIENLMNYVGIQAAGEMYKPTKKFAQEKYYMLTLPFAVRVRDLSEQLGGYAIVSIPDEEKTGANGAFFKIEMQTVPANTLMLFRVDQTVEEFEAMEFTGVKIEAPSEETQQVKSCNGVDFVSVYAKTNSANDNDYFLWPDGNTFYKTSSSTINQGNGLDIYPFNGYIHFEKSANARIFIEGADGTVTAINAITGDVVNDNAEGWYTVGGMKLDAQPTQKGVYINNGKKVVIK